MVTKKILYQHVTRFKPLVKGCYSCYVKKIIQLVCNWLTSLVLYVWKLTTLGNRSM